MRTAENSDPSPSVCQSSRDARSEDPVAASERAVLVVVVFGVSLMFDSFQILI
jgi:hypothetical protein